MKTPADFDEHRRQVLVKLLSMGAFALGSGAVSARLLGAVPNPLPAGQSVYSVEGDVRVNGKPVQTSTPIRASDLVETGANSSVIFVVGRDAFITRSNTKLQLAAAGAEEFVVGTLRLVTGKLLSVFGKSTHSVQTATATIGIRGTGVYVEADPDETYICTCYGTTELSANDKPDATETITSQHHDAPRYILAKGDERIRPAPFKNHTDAELALIESLVGRTTPFELPGEAYGRPRRSTY
ncbi:MAG: hypothetical protein U1F34_00355 [Gammaproteobacteria bacterium]